MNAVPAISLWQPWASLLVTRQPDIAGQYYRDLPPMQMIKRFETRSWPCPPKYWGQRMAFHATLRGPEIEVGDYAVIERQDGTYGIERWRPPRLELDCDLPLGAVVGSGIVTACYPIRRQHPAASFITDYVLSVPDAAVLQLWVDGEVTDISDQLPYGNYSLDEGQRFAWLIEGAAPTTERCPWCWGSGSQASFEGTIVANLARRDFPCPVCEGAGHCGPIPAKGKQRIWNWTPEVIAA